MARRRVKWIALVAVTGLVAVSVSAVVAVAGRTTERDVTIDQIPQAVKATILKEAGENTIEEIEEVSRNGKVILYEAEWTAAGKEIEIEVDPKGKLLSKEVDDDDDDDDDDD